VKLNEIRESGLIEYYVLGLLSDQEVKEVEGYLVQYPELQVDYFEIQRSIQAYAQTNGIEPKIGLENSILSTIRESGDQSKVTSSENSKSSNERKEISNDNSSGLWKDFFLVGLLLSTLFFAWKSNTTSNSLDTLQTEFDALETQCDSIKDIQTQKIENFKKLSSHNNRTLDLTPTDRYKETSLLFHINNVEKQNFIQIKNVPSIASNQAFQLWSLKDGQDPIPLTVFKDGDDIVIPVDYEDGTGTYAITIEDENGAQSPTLSRLIGTVSVS